MKKVNETAFLDYLASCEADKGNIARQVTEVFTPAFASIGITDETKIKALVTPLIDEKTADIDKTIEFLKMFVEEVAEPVIPIEQL